MMSGDLIVMVLAVVFAGFVLRQYQKRQEWRERTRWDW